MAQGEGLQVVLLSLFVILLLVVYHSQLGVNKRVRRIDFLGLQKRNSGSLQIVCPQVLHPHVKMGLRASREEPDDGSINGHGLVGLVLDGKGVRHANPRVEEAIVQLNSLLEVFPCDLILFAVEVIGAHSEPTHWMR